MNDVADRAAVDEREIPQADRKVVRRKRRLERLKQVVLQEGSCLWCAA